ncbi:hypothetical protein DLEV_011 [Diachasmimorpha longicaudata entomopoxvirus]|uniref:Uncharacterized protein n=1 Tax=Diachasmimorpha longicaudata entomopoxvirus TaxID=109981 RepID=A0A7R5WCU6_9POXV|nr:hypothetical protein QKK69_gp011 [Diachasmimorpha longicaudata entomopoxvirus]AKS26302.1 hypothetical protein DLEV_011 [Diachasmimorpha longicaudata entomopoxvirus]
MPSASKMTNKANQREDLRCNDAVTRTVAFRGHLMCLTGNLEKGFYIQANPVVHALCNLFDIKNIEGFIRSYVSPNDIVPLNQLLAENLCDQNNFALNPSVELFLSSNGLNTLVDAIDSAQANDLQHRVKSFMLTMEFELKNKQFQQTAIKKQPRQPWHKRLRKSFRQMMHF